MKALSDALRPVKTPLVRWKENWVKLEGHQLTGSVKYRMVYAKVQEAILGGALDPGMVLTEVSSGSTGIALSFLGKELGMEVEIHIFSNCSEHKQSRMTRLGARLVVHPLSTPISDLLGEVSRRSETGTHWHLNQYDEESVSKSYRAFGGELLTQIALAEMQAAAPTRFVCPVGTGGLIQGLGAFLRKAIPTIKIVSVEPDPGAAIDGMRNTLEFHAGAADPYNREFPDSRFTVPKPLGRMEIDGHRLGESASASCFLIEDHLWKDCLVVAADGA